jgi:hypothetical protein
VFAAVEALEDRLPITQVMAKIQRAWIGVLIEIEDRASVVDGDTLNLMFAEHALDNLFFLGDGGWKVLARPKIVVLDGLSETESQTETVADQAHGRPALDEEFGQRDLVARFEIVDVTPFLLNWLKTDPARLAQLSPDQFEKLVANRLRANGFTVYQNGNTYERGGGIDLFAVANVGEVPSVVSVIWVQ